MDWNYVGYGCKENAGVFSQDGNILHVKKNNKYPGIERCDLVGCTGQLGRDVRWYRLEKDHGKRADTLSGAKKLLWH